MERQTNAVPQDRQATFLSHTAVSHIGLQVPDPENVADFYGRTVGLVVHRRDADGGIRLGWGTGHHVIDLSPGERKLTHYGFEVRDDGGIERIRSAITAAGREFSEIDPDFVDEAVREPEGVSTTDADNNTLHFHSAVWRQGEGAAAPSRRPVKYQHITIGTDNVSAFVSYFTDIIGFRVSDQLTDGNFMWLRSDKDHHTLAAVFVGSKGNVDHYSYDLAEWEDFKVWCDKLTELDVPVQWGPGRHGPGSNLFIFFDDPAGNHIELSAEMERFYDDRVEYTPRRWKPTNSTINLWGGQLARWRRLSEGDVQ